MEKNEIIQNLITVTNVLNTLRVAGKQDLLNLGGSIDMLEKIVQALTAPAPEEPKVPEKPGDSK